MIVHFITIVVLTHRQKFHFRQIFAFHAKVERDIELQTENPEVMSSNKRFQIVPFVIKYDL